MLVPVANLGSRIIDFAVVNLAAHDGTRVALPAHVGHNLESFSCEASYLQLSHDGYAFSIDIPPATTKAQTARKPPFSNLDA
jgi:hypothetical protein